MGTRRLSAGISILSTPQVTGSINPVGLGLVMSTEVPWRLVTKVLNIKDEMSQWARRHVRIEYPKDCVTIEDSAAWLFSYNATPGDFRISSDDRHYFFRTGEPMRSWRGKVGGLGHFTWPPGIVVTLS